MDRFLENLKCYFDNDEAVHDKARYTNHRIPDAVFVTVTLPVWYYFAFHDLSDNVPDVALFSVTAESDKYHVTLTTK